MSGSDGPFARSVDQRRRVVLLVLLGLLSSIVQACLVGRTQPFSAIGSSASFWFLDHPFHLYQIEFGRQLLAHGQVVGFDPFFGGGYLGGMSFNQSARIPVLLSALLPTVDTSTLYALYIAACSTVVPLLLVWLAIELRCTIAQAVAITLFGLAFWWISALRWYQSAGMVSFVLACYVALPHAVWIWRLCTRGAERTGPGLLAAALVGAMGLWLHTLFALLVVFLFASCVVAWSVGPNPLRFVARGSFLGLVGVVSSLPWVIAMVEAPSLIFDHPYQRDVGLKVVFGSVLGVPNGLLTPIYFLVAAQFVVALLWRPRLATMRASPLALAGVALLVFAAYGGLLRPLATMQPNRFAAPGFLMLGIAGSLTTLELASRVWRDGAGWQRVSLLFVVLLVTTVTGREWVREIEAGPHGHYGKGPPEMTEVPPSVDRIAEWIGRNTTPDGRVLFETSNGRVHARGHVASMLALMTGREFMGGAYPFSQKRQSFYDHTGFGKPLSELGIDELKRGFDLYNIGWIVSHSSELQHLLASAPFVREVARFDNVAAYVVVRPLSFTARGEARIERRAFDRLDVVAARQPEIVLRYNWTPLLRTCPAARIEAVVVEPDFPPLIRIVDPPPAFTITTGSACGG